jgi:putative ABC transport system substrate-binding protein
MIVATGTRELTMPVDEGQPRVAIPRVGLLAAGDRSYPSVAAFVDGLARLGYLQDRSIRLDTSFAEGRLDRLPALALEMARHRPDVIATIGAVTFHAVREATTDIPIVFGVVLDAVEAGIVADAERPGGNVTGATSFDPGQSARQIGLLKRTLPSLERLAILGDAGVPPILAQRATAAADAEGLQSTVRLLGAPEDVVSAVGQSRADGAQALLVLEVPRTSTHAALIVSHAHAAGLPTMFGLDLARASPMLAYGTSLAGAARRMASLVDRILRGARPGDLPVQTVAEPALVVNARVARKLGVPIPSDVLMQASRVVDG